MLLAPLTKGVRPVRVLGRSLIGRDHPESVSLTGVSDLHVSRNACSLSSREGRLQATALKPCVRIGDRQLSQGETVEDKRIIHESEYHRYIEHIND